MKTMILLALLVLSGCTPKTEEGDGPQYLYSSIVCEVGTYNAYALERSSGGGVYVNRARQYDKLCKEASNIPTSNSKEVLKENPTNG